MWHGCGRVTRYTPLLLDPRDVQQAAETVSELTQIDAEISEAPSLGRHRAATLGDRLTAPQGVRC